MADEKKGGFGGLLNTVKGFVFEDVPADKPAAQPGPPVQQAPPQAANQYTQPIFTPAAAPSYSAAPATGTGKVDPKMVEHFNHLLETGNLPGNDYFEFRRSLDNMSKANLPDNSKYPAAFFALGITVQVLQDSANHYLGLFDKDAADFKQAMVEQKTNKVDIYNVESQQLVDENARIDQQIAELQAKKQQNLARVAEVAGLAVEAEGKIQTRALDYEFTRQQFIQTIQSDLQNIQTYVMPVVAATQGQ